MKIRIIPAAMEDLERGHAFYERQAEGLGDYFLDSLFSDIDSLILTRASIARRLAFIACCRTASRS